MTTPDAGGLHGLRVLVPRGGPWGEDVAARLRRLGAEPVVVPLIAFAPPEDAAPLDAAIADLRLGGFDWLVVTSATTVDALVARGAVVPPATRVAAVGAATRAACERAGLAVDLVPSADHSALGLADELPADAGRVLLPQSDLADPGLARALAARGALVTAAVAYRTVAAAVDDAVRADVAAGRIGAILVTSGSVARQVAAQLAPLPPGTLVACLGPNTATEAEAAGLHVDVIAPDRSIPSLLTALATQAAAT
jgi:uroporphyrinogen-III synthase